MSYYATETIVRDIVIAAIKAIHYPEDGDHPFNGRNVLPVPQFIPIEVGWAGWQVQVLLPQSIRSGAGGGTYLENITVGIGLFRRTDEDSKGEWKKVSEQLSELMFRICQAIEGLYINGSTRLLDIALYRDGTPITPGGFADASGPVPGVLWCSATFRGMRGNSTAEFIIRNVPEPEPVPVP